MMQTKPLRSFGIDVTQTSMQPILDELGINKQVKNMSQAEKEILRYLATLKQAKTAMGDLANTIESPSNQLKIFKQQLVETKVAISSLFMGLYSNVLPYANAFLMVVKEISKAIADMFGIELTDYNSGIVSQDGIYDGIADSADNASKAVKELKRQTLGFDEIHNINENKDTGSGNISSGIDQRLLDAIAGYDNGMDKVRMKATQIRDRIMEWLGFTKEIDPLTGEVSFKLKEGYSNLKLIGGIVATLIGLKIFGGLKNIAKGILGVDSLVTLSGNNLTSIGKIIKSLKVSGWGATIAKIGAKIKTVLPVLGKAVAGVGGIAGVIFGSKGTYNGLKELTKGSDDTKKSIGKLAIGFGEATAGGAMLGSIIPGVGTVVGALGGAIIGLTSSLLGYKKGIEELAKDNIFGDVSISTAEWKDMLDNLGISINDNTERFETLKTTVSNLKGSFDEGAEKLDFYGIKFGKMAQKITDEDAVNIKNSIKNMCSSATSIIEENTNYGLELVSSTFKQGTTIAEEEQSKMLNSILNYGNKQKDEIKSAQDNITKTYDNAIKTRGYLTDEEYKYISEQLQKIRTLTNNEMSKSQTDIEYYKTLFADKNQKLDEASYKNYKTALDQFHKEKLEAIENTYNQELNFAKSMLETNQWTLDEYNKYTTDIYNNRNNSVATLNDELLNSTDKVTESLKKRYTELLSDNSALAKKQKELIKNILGNFEIDTNTLTKEFRKAGLQAYSSFSEGFGSGGGASYFNMKISGIGGSGGRKANGGVYSNGSWKDIPQYANGGAPSHGTMFWAGEHGPEIVAHANGKTEVLNQSQIASAIYSAVYSAMSQFGGQTGEIDVHVHTDEGTVVDRINQKIKQTGVCPINIPLK